MSVNGREFESFIYKETVLLDPGVLVNCYSVSSPFLLGEETESKVVTQSMALNCYLWSSAFFGDVELGQGRGVNSASVLVVDLPEPQRVGHLSCR